MDNFRLDVGQIMRAAFEHQGNGDIPQALVMLGRATAMAAFAGAYQAPPRMFAGNGHAYLAILSVVFAWGLATMWAGLWAYLNPRFRRAVGMKMFYAAVVVLFLAAVSLGDEVNLSN